MADLEARLLDAQRDGDAAERRAELAERQSAEAHRLILDMQVRPSDVCGGAGLVKAGASLLDCYRASG